MKWFLFFLVLRQEINDNFQNNKAETDPEIIKQVISVLFKFAIWVHTPDSTIELELFFKFQLIKDAYLAETQFKKVIQLEETSPGHFSNTSDMYLLKQIQTILNL